MEFLKKITSVVWFAALVQPLFSQTQAALQDAFASSIALEKEKKYPEAISALESVYTADRYELNLRMGWLYYLHTQYDQSVAYYKKAISAMPAATEPLWGIINSYVAKGDWVNTEASYLAILKTDPGNATASYRVGLIYYNRKNYTAAKKHFDVSLNQNPFDYYSLLMSGWTNYFLGKPSEAKVLFHKVLLCSPNDASALEGLSLIK